MESVGLTWSPRGMQVDSTLAARETRIIFTLEFCIFCGAHKGVGYSELCFIFLPWRIFGTLASCVQTNRRRLVCLPHDRIARRPCEVCVEWSDGNYISTIAFSASPSNKRRGAVWRLVIVFMRVFCILLVVLQQHLGMRARVRLIYFRLCASRFIGAKFVQARSHKYAFIGSECVPTPKPPHPDRPKSRY